MMHRSSLIRKTLAVLCVCNLLACAMFNPESRREGPTVRSVPYEARPMGVEGLRKRLLVLPFIDENTARGATVTSVARSAVIRQLDQTKQFVLVKPSDLSEDPGKHITENREYDLEKIATQAASLGVAAVIEGKVLEIKAKRIGDQVGIIRDIKASVDATIRIRMVSARNGRIILEETKSGHVESTTTRVAEYSFSDAHLEEDPHLVELAANKAFSSSLLNIVKGVDKISWEGRVATISGERVFINAGHVSGIQIGDILKVTEEGEEVFDPETGTFIGRAPGRMKGTVEVVQYFGSDGSIALIHSGAGFKENDRVELY